MRDPVSNAKIGVSFETIDDLLDDVQRGKLRIPSFQRPYRWKPADMLSLFDSIRNGHPIGSLLIWSPEEPRESSDRVGPNRVPPGGRDAKYVVDGHQRIATLFGVLRFKESPDTGEDVWRWHVYYDLVTGKFAHCRRGQPEPWLLPLRLLRRTMGLVEFANRLRQAPLPAEVGDADALLDEADTLSQRLKGYKLLLMTLEKGSIEDAIESFSRMNAKGQDIAPHEILSALTYEEGAFHLDRRINDISRGLAELGFVGIHPNAILRVVLAIGGARDVYRTDWALLAKEMKDEIAVHTARSEAALLRAAMFLRERGVLTGRLLPYVHHMVFLAVYFDSHPTPPASDLDMLERWFWGTSFAESFAGISAAETSRWLKAMRGNVAAELADAVYAAEPYPTQLRLSSARVRVHLLAVLRGSAPPHTSGERLGPAEVGILESRGGPPYVFEDIGEPERSDPANRVLLPVARDARSDLLRRSDEDLRAHAIRGEALDALRRGDGVAFVRARRSELQELERAVMCELGVRPSERDSAEPMTDTDDGR